MGRLILISLLLTVAAPVRAQDGQAVPYLIVAEGSRSGIHRLLTQVVRDGTTWEALWRRHAAGRNLPPPPVDFSRRMVLAVFAGDSEARAVKITRILRQSGGIVVWYRLDGIRPLPDGPRQTSTPFQIVSVRAMPLPVEFKPVKSFPPTVAP